VVDVEPRKRREGFPRGKSERVLLLCGRLHDSSTLRQKPPWVTRITACASPCPCASVVKTSD
jgi:hypothetical protein